MTTHKVCKACLQDKPHADFSKDSSRKDGLQTRCRACFQLYRQANAVQLSAYGSKYRENNKEAVAKRKHAYYSEHKEKYAGYVKDYRFANPDRVKELARAWAKANPTKVKQYKREFVQKLPDSYIFHKLRLQDVRREDVPAELLEAKRQQLQVRRLAALVRRELNAIVKHPQRSPQRGESDSDDRGSAPSGG